MIFGDASVKVEHVREVMTQYHSYWAGWNELTAHYGPMDELVKAVAEMPVSVPGLGKRTYGEGLDYTALLNKAIYLRHLDPEVLIDWANGAGDIEAYKNVTRGYDEKLLRDVSCPVLILQGNMEMGAIMSDAEVKYALTLMPHDSHVYLEGVVHNLGLYS